MKQLIFLLFLFTVNQFLALTDSTLAVREDKLVLLLNDLRSAQNDEEKIDKNSIFKDYLSESLRLPGALTYSFSKLKTVGFVDSPDGLLRIVNWNVEQDDRTQKYYCFILHSVKKDVEVSELIDNSYMESTRPEGVLEAPDWYGALYYKIIPIEKGAKTMYTLLGWDGNNSMSTIKMIDVLYFSGDNPKLGSPIFKTKEHTYKRYFFEHSKKATMSLKYEEEYKRLIFDHLSPESPNLVGFYSFYLPDLSYDAFMLEGNKWVLKEDVIGINKAAEKETAVYVKNERNGKIEKKEIKNKWINPSDIDAPGGGSEHIAITPEQDLQNSNAEKDNLDKKVPKYDKRDPNNLNTTLGKQKKRKKTKS